MKSRSEPYIIELRWLESCCIVADAQFLTYRRFSVIPERYDFNVILGQYDENRHYMYVCIYIYNIYSSWNVGMVRINHTYHNLILKYADAYEDFSDVQG